jgi:hypothetical protein
MSGRRDYTPRWPSASGAGGSIRQLVITCGLALAALSAVSQITLQIVLAQGAPAQVLDPDIQRLLEQYAMAFESLDADAVKKVQPTIEVENLRRAFGQMRALEVKIDAVKVLSLEGAAARVSGRVTQTLTPRAGSRQTTSVTRVMRLRRVEGAWVIDSFER